MARISESQKENISLMSVDLGGSMSSAQIRVESKGNPVLIIGLGGTGMDALLYGTGNEKISIQYEGSRGITSYTTSFEGIIPTLERRYRETSSDAMKQMF